MTDVRNLNTTVASDGRPYVLEQLASLSSAVTTVPDRILGAARRTLLDTIGVSIAGAATPAGMASLRAAGDIWGAGNTPVWFFPMRLPKAGAAFVNASFASALDLDDGHRQASGHPAAAIVPAVLAVAEEYGSSADQILTAIAIGYEVAVRVASSRDIGRLRTTDTGLWCGYGVAAAAAWLADLPEAISAHAMAIAGQTASAQAATGWTRVGHTVKEGIAWATANGMQAVALATAGHRGPIDILDEARRFERNKLLETFDEHWAIERSYFKIYSCCRWAHAAIDAALALQSSMRITATAIDAILVETFDRALTLSNTPDPHSSEAAQYSIPYCVALALVKGETALLPMTTMFLTDPEVLSLARRIKLVASSGYRGAFPDTTPARVTIVAGEHRQSLEVRFPKGDPQNALTAGELQAKFLTLATQLPIEEPQLGSLLEAINGLGLDFGAADLFRSVAPA